MHARFAFIGAILVLLSVHFLPASSAKPKILHLSFHHGCCKDIEEVARELDLDVTSWFVSSENKPEVLDGITTDGNIYNISHARAKRIWDIHKDYFNTFDMIITSDTAPLSRIFLQNNWKKPLIIWVCNRFDYCHGDPMADGFPDHEYYYLFKQATRQKNVKVIGYTKYEHYYASRRGIDLGPLTITPIGAVETGFRQGTQSSIPAAVQRKETMFIFPRLDAEQLRYIENQCAAMNIKTYSGAYNGPCDLEGFKGIIYFPYAWSNLAPFENMHRGIIHFMPTESFVLQLAMSGVPVRVCTLDLFHLVEWYFPEHREAIVYFDSWQDLKHKIETTDYALMASKAKQHAREHRKTMLAHWQHVFNELNALL